MFAPLHIGGCVRTRSRGRGRRKSAPRRPGGPPRERRQGQPHGRAPREAPGVRRVAEGGAQARGRVRCRVKRGGRAGAVSGSDATRRSGGVGRRDRRGARLEHRVVKRVTSGGTVQRNEADVAFAPHEHGREVGRCHVEQRVAAEQLTRTATAPRVVRAVAALEAGPRSAARRRRRVGVCPRGPPALLRRRRLYRL